MAPITPAIVREGERIAVFESAEYYSLPVVYRINRDGELIFYSTLREWPRTEIGRVAGLLHEINELQQRNAELEERLAQAVVLDEFTAPDVEETPAGILCSCGRRFADRRALSAHQRRAFIHKIL